MHRCTECGAYRINQGFFLLMARAGRYAHAEQTHKLPPPHTTEQTQVAGHPNHKPSWAFTCANTSAKLNDTVTPHNTMDLTRVDCAPPSDAQLPVFCFSVCVCVLSLYFSLSLFSLSMRVD